MRLKTPFNAGLSSANLLVAPISEPAQPPARTQYGSGAVIDEAQRAPELFSYLQQELDESSRKGRFILTGSNNFLLQETISQSLAGRIAYLYLLPFILSELSAAIDTDLAVQIIKGSYPPVYDQEIDPGKWYPNYIRTYVERDLRQIKNISDLKTFERFVRLCAGRSGQLLNLSSLALEAGVDSKTAVTWISVFESSFIVFRLYPWHRNFNKRIVKMPKLYFYDTGLVCSLLGIANSNQLTSYALYIRFWFDLRNKTEEDHTGFFSLERRTQDKKSDFVQIVGSYRSEAEIY